MMPLYEAKMIHHYDTKWATYEPDGSTRYVTAAEKRDPDFDVMPRYWVAESEVGKKLDAWTATWMIGWRRIARSTDERTFITTALPSGAYGDSVFLLLPAKAGARRQFLQAALSSAVFDFVVRQKIGGTNASFFFVEQFPAPTPDTAEQARQVGDLVDRLNAQRLDAATAAQLRAELDAQMFHVYGVDRDDVDHIMDTFPILRDRDFTAHGTYRSKDLVLAAYDRLYLERSAHAEAHV